MSRCTLELGGESIVVATGGTLDVEYTLFDPSDIELSATGPGTIRETGYRTTVGEARPRLENAGLTRELAEQAAAHVVSSSLARAYARGAAVRRIAERLDALELFDGRTYDPVAARYAGAWLDLSALASALAARIEPARGSTAASVLQGLFLAMLLGERPDDVPLALTTSDITAQRRPGERTFRRLQLGDVKAWVDGLRGLKPGVRDPAGAEAGPGRREIVRALRDRAQRVPALAPRCTAVENTLHAREQPARGPLADPELWALEVKLSMGETAGVGERVESIERQRGRLPGTTYLRARVALMAGTEDPRSIAEHVSAISTSMAAFHELQLLAAQAWAAAGDVRRAHAFARDLSENNTACDALRMHAREVLDATGQATTAPEGGIPVIPKPPLAPSGTDLRVPPSDPPSSPPTSKPPSDRGWPRGYPRVGSWTADLAFPSYRVEPIRGPLPEPAASPEAGADEGVEGLSLPPGAQDEPPPHDEPPRSAHAARLAFTYLARELGRELRMRHGVDLRMDVDGLEIAQRYLLEDVPGERAASSTEEREILRHGAFLSELLARRLAGQWVDLEPPDPARWAMLVRSRSQGAAASRVWPLGRVLRFVAQRHKERDLVSYYLELEAFAR